MKKSFLTLLLTTFMLMFTASVAFASETGSSINIPGQVVAEENGYRLIAINPELSDGEVQMVEIDCNDNSNDEIMPLENGVNRTDPIGIMVCPVIDYNGEATILDLDGLSLYAPARPSIGYIVDDITREEQASIMAKVESLGYKQIGWYFIGGYKLDTYRAINWSFNVYVESGVSDRQGKSATNGENYFEVVSYFPNGVPTNTEWEFGIRGTVTYQSFLSYSTVTAPIALIIEMK